MKLDLPKILMSIILAITLQSGYCELKNPIDILQVDSVEVLAVNPFTLSEFRVDRLHFDDVFRIYNKSSIKNSIKASKGLYNILENSKFIAGFNTRGS